MGLGGCRSDPRGRHRRVEFDARQPGGLDLANRRERLFEAADRQAALRCQRPLAVDDHRGESFGRQQRPLDPALRLRLGKLDRAARVAERCHADRNFGKRGEIIGHVHVAVPQPRNQRLALAVDDPRTGRGRTGFGRTDPQDLAALDVDVLAGDKRCASASYIGIANSTGRRYLGQEAARDGRASWQASSWPRRCINCLIAAGKTHPS